MLHRPLGRLPYRDAWQIQEQAHESVVAGGDEQIITVEHPPVITFGRRAELSASHLLASAPDLARAGVEVVESDRGGDITFHGPGQLVVYPIVRLADHRLSVGGYVRLLESAVVRMLREDFGLDAVRDPSAVGVWVRREPRSEDGTGHRPPSPTPDGPVPAPAHDTSSPGPAKICAIGVRVRRGVTLHGLALNVSTDLRYFDLIVPCGLPGRPVTSLARLLPKPPEMGDVASRLLRHLGAALASAGSGESLPPAPTLPDPAASP